jgi:cyclopropane fatty-acyl-phospholipid synthase-like methyltransferase
MDQKDVKNWYNSFSANQVKTGTNIRHFNILSELVDSGLKRGHRVLEIGCGIGTLTGLINQYLKKGKLVATDISNESIEIAKKTIKGANKIDFIVTDMIGFKSDDKFDFIVLPDVMEHIPLEQHEALFKTMANCIHDESIIFIHIPHPTALDSLRRTSPEKLQIIDQSISAKDMIINASAANLRLIEYRAYSLTAKQTDYVFIKFKKDTPFDLIQLPKSKIIKKKTLLRLRLLLR